MSYSLRSYLKSCAIAVVTVSSLAQAATAQETATEEETAVQDTIIVTGARGKPRSVMDSPVPIDVLGAEDIAAVPFTDTNDVLKTLVPSYSLSRQPISDGGSFIRPASMRGLPTDKTLVLVNSKRRHRAALVSIGGSGTQGPDVATIPASALKSVEVLRDGAAAQYGSDAIAGVINFILKDNSSGGSASIDVGQYTEGDGLQYTLAGNYGFDLGGKGFVSVSGEYSKADATVRAAPYCESWACTDPSDPRFASGGGSFDDTLSGYSLESYTAGLPDANIGDGDVVQPWGQPTSEALRFFVNAGYELGETAELYGFANYSQSESDGSFFYRYPGNGTIEDLRLEDGSLYSPLEKFPGGFTPRFFGEVIDYSALGGVKGEIAGGFTYDVSGRFGHNEIKYTLKNTINPSMGPDSPTSFRPGDLINEEIQLQADFAKEFEIGLSSPLLFAFGTSYMDESYELVGGDEASYSAGPFSGADPFDLCLADMSGPTAAGSAVIAAGSTLDCTDDADPVYRVVGVGSNGFPGYSPEFSGEYTRDSYAFYADVSTDVTDSLFVQSAVRYEKYSDFDAETVWKLAGRYEFSDMFAVRGSVGTGFRAPTPGQQGTTNVSTRLPNGFPVATGLFPAGGAIAQALGAQSLKPELSTNYTLGFTSTVDAFSLTVDFYQIELEDRFYAVSTRDVSSDATGDADAYANFLALQGAGVVGAESIGGVFYFANAFDTTTTGVDVVATYTKDWEGDHSTKFSGSLNYNKTEFDTDVATLSNFLNAEDQYDFENGSPEFKGVFTADHSVGDFSLLLRANYYGGYENSRAGAGSLIQDFAPIVQFDLEAAYDFSDQISGAFGIRNLLDEYPNVADPSIGDTCCGRIYRSDAVVDWQGSYVYAKLSANF